MSESKKALTRIFNIDELVYPRYKKLNIESIFKVGTVYHCETEEGQYVWLELHSGRIIIDKAETSYEMGDDANVVAKYTGEKPTLSEVIKHFSWRVDEENIWDD